MKAQLRFVTDRADKKARGVTNSLAAYEGIIPDRPSDSFRQKKGKGKGKSGSGGAAVVAAKVGVGAGAGGAKKGGRGKK